MSSSGQNGHTTPVKQVMQDINPAREATPKAMYLNPDRAAMLKHMFVQSLKTNKPLSPSANVTKDEELLKVAEVLGYGAYKGGDFSDALTKKTVRNLRDRLRELLEKRRQAGRQVEVMQQCIKQCEEDIEGLRVEWGLTDGPQPSGTTTEYHTANNGDTADSAGSSDNGGASAGTDDENAPAASPIADPQSIKMYTEWLVQQLEAQLKIQEAAVEAQKGLMQQLRQLQEPKPSP
mmetsp:Transcript_29411/g.75025  ORF Transcript_29411/g.75025 Transcript_29411/m.75025 type:complete len:234 (-) Transcript_29411:208-909(-)